MCFYSVFRTHNESHECNLEEVYRELVYFVGSVYFVKYFCNSEQSLQCPTEHYRNLSIVVSMTSFKFTLERLFDLKFVLPE